jgi:uncharacterized membrane protein YphA (DoxX/SURF4 family)
MAAIVLGVMGLISGDFATDWQRVPPNTLLREPLAYLTAFFEIGAGIAIYWRRSARLGALLLINLYAIFTVLWIIQAVKVPWVYDGWGNVFEELSLVIGGLAAYAALAPPDSAWAGRVGVISRIFAVCPISFGIVHLLNLAVVAQWTPGWIPPGQMFWAIATAVFFFLAAASILLGIASHVAAALLTAQILGFEILVWLPKAIETPRSHFAWAGNGIAWQSAQPHGL